MVDITSDNDQLHPISRKLLLRSVRRSEKEYIEKQRGDFNNVICFSLINETYGIELDLLQEVLKAVSISPVPGSPDYLRGLINLRGNLITVVDLKKRLGFERTEITDLSRVIIVKTQNRFIGLLVDRVMEIIRLKQDDLIDTDIGLSRIDARFIEKIGKNDDKIIIFPNLDAVFQSPV